MAKTRPKHATNRSAAQSLQKFVCQKIGELLELPHGKDTSITSRESGQSGTDVRLLNDALRRFPFSIECKNAKVWNMQGAIRQARRNMAPGTAWMLVLKRRSKLAEDRIPPVVVMDAEVFFQLLTVACGGTWPMEVQNAILQI